MSEQESPVERLRRAANVLEQTAATTQEYVTDPWGGLVRDTLVPWVALMRPALAAPLAAWLRDAEQAIRHDVPVENFRRALAVADVILGGGR